MARQIVNVKKIQRRSRRLTVRETGVPGVFKVASGSRPGKFHSVNLNGDHPTCTCEWGQYGGTNCSHILAARNYLSEKQGRRLSFWKTEEEALRQRRPRFLFNGLWATARRV